MLGRERLEAESAYHHVRWLHNFSLTDQATIEYVDPTCHELPEKQSKFRKQQANPYQILKVKRTGETNDIRRAYRKAAVQLHPDIGWPADNEQAFKRITWAWEILSDEETRELLERTGVVPLT